MGGNKQFRRVQGRFEMIADESSCARNERKARRKRARLSRGWALASVNTCGKLGGVPVGVEGVVSDDQQAKKANTTTCNSDDEAGAMAMATATAGPGATCVGGARGSGLRA